MLKSKHNRPIARIGQCPHHSKRKICQADCAKKLDVREHHARQVACKYQRQELTVNRSSQNKVCMLAAEVALWP